MQCRKFHDKVLWVEFMRYQYTYAHIVLLWMATVKSIATSIILIKYFAINNMFRLQQLQHQLAQSSVLIFSYALTTFYMKIQQWLYKRKFNAPNNEQYSYFCKKMFKKCTLIKLYVYFKTKSKKMSLRAST